MEIDRGTSSPQRIAYTEAGQVWRVGEYSYTLNITGLSGTLEVNDTLTGDASEAFGFVLSYVGGVLKLKSLNGAFVEGEGITAGNGATATISTITVEDDTQQIATVLDSPVNGRIMYWDGTAFQMTQDANLTFSSGTLSSTQLKSTAATGTAPIVVASTTLVSNLNADL